MTSARDDFGMPPSVAQSDYRRTLHKQQRNRRKPLRQSVFKRVLHKQHATVMRIFPANACFCLTFPIGSKFPLLQRSSGAKTRCPHDTSLLHRRKENRIARGGPQTVASQWKDGGRDDHTQQACRSRVTHHSEPCVLAWSQTVPWTRYGSPPPREGGTHYILVSF
jgi:hypothetical protein